MAENRDELFRWRRLTAKNRPSSTVTKKPTKPSNDIQDWIKKVEEASNHAAAVTFGTPARGQRSNGHGTVEATLDALHDHDEAHQEAQDLLSQWMAEKCDLDEHVTMDEDEMETGLDYGGGDSQRSLGVKGELRSHWDDMLERNDPSLTSNMKYTSSDALYADIESRDDYSTVQSILGAMMEKEVIEPSQKKKLRTSSEEKKRSDPRTTMAARQQKVKENREKREQERRQQMMQKQSKKSAQHQARQMVQQEEKQKALKVQKEELMIREEMARIRKEMLDQKKREEDTRARERAIEEEARREMEEKRRKEIEVMRRIEGARRMQEEEDRGRMEEKRIREAQEALRLRTLQRHFHAWYRLVRDQRLQMGKARALSDWRCLLRSWNAWRAYVRACRAEREAKQTEMDIKLTHRRKHAADSHYRLRVLRRTFTAWQVFCRQESQEKEVSQQQSKTRSKMAAFLEAAASGRLWTDRSEGGEEMEEEEEEDARGYPRSGRDGSMSARSMAAQFDRASDLISSRSDPSSKPSTAQGKPEKRMKHQSSKKPKHAWQVTRKHANLTPEEIASIGDTMDPSMAGIPSNEHPPSGGKQGKKPIQYTVNNFEHRYAAQQRLLSEQQEQLREQRRLIEELQVSHMQKGMKKDIEQIKAGEYVHEMEEPPGGHPLDNMFKKGDNSARSDRTERTDGSSTARTNLSEGSASTNRTRTSSRPQPPLLKGMEDRATQRAKLKAEREERQKQKEQQKLAEMQAEEERKVAEEEGEKKAAIERRKEAKRLAKQREVEKQQRIEHAQMQLVQADAHYQTTLLRRYGFNPWRKLVRMAGQNMQVAIDHASNKVLHACLMSWHHMTQEVIAHKNDLADVRCREILLRRSFNSWKRFGHYQSIQLQKARRHYLHRLKLRTLVAWRDWATDERLRAWEAEELAEEQDTKRIMRTAFRAWKRYPKMLKEERSKEIRRQEMRRKVASLIPDFGLT